MNKFIPVNTPRFIGNEKKYLSQCIDTGWISSEGPFVKQFENKFAAYVSRKHGIAVSNGSVALDIAIKALKIGEGDEVILPTFTIISCVGAVLRQGAVPVFVDSDPLTWNMDVSAIKMKITSKTKAIMAVHIYGLTVDMKPLLTLAKENNLFVIEDAAEAIGLKYLNSMCGSFGHISTFSFYPNKHITTGEGGMIVTNDSQLAERARSLRNLCFKKERRFIHDELGWNGRMSNLQAAVGLAQLEQIERNIKRKKEIGMKYNQLFDGLKNIVQFPLIKTSYAENIYWIYGMVLSNSKYESAAEVIESLKVEKIGTRPFFFPLHNQPLLLNMNLKNSGEEYPVADNLAANGFYIPSGLGLTDQEIEYVAYKVIGVLE
jgi:perosamine synthetase